MKTKDGNHLVKHIGISYDALDSTGDYLEKMALKGWILEDIRGFKFIFVKSEPKKLRYCVCVIPEESMFETKITESSIEYADYCKKAGWDLVCHISNLSVFSTTDETAMPIESDEELKYKLIKKNLKFWNYDIPLNIFVWVTFYLCLSLFFDFYDPFLSMFLFSNMILELLIVAVCGVILIRYMLWNKKAQESLKYGRQISFVTLIRPENRLKSFIVILTIIGVLHSCLILAFSPIIDTLWVLAFWFVLLLFFFILFKYKEWVKDKDIGSEVNKVLIFVIMFLCLNCFFIICAWIFILRGDKNENKKYEVQISMDDLDILAGSEDSDMKVDDFWSRGHFILSYDVYKLRSNQHEISVTKHNTKLKSLYNLLLRDHSSISVNRIEYDFSDVDRISEFESDGVTVRGYLSDGDYHVYLIYDEDDILQVRTDYILDKNQVEVIKRVFMR